MISEGFKNILKKVNCYYSLLLFRKSIYDKWNIYRYKKRYTIKASGIFCCNCCSNRFDRMVDWSPAKENERALTTHQVVAGYGQNIICPACLSTARERLIIEMLKQSVNWKGKKILLVAPEEKIYQYLKSDAFLITADWMPELYKNIDSKIQKENLTELSYSDHFFDLVIANHVLEHVPDDLKAMREIYRILKRGGQAILQVPYSMINELTIEEPGLSDPQRQSELFGQKDHVRIYAIIDYVSRLENAGFLVKIIPYEDLKEMHHFAIQKNEAFFLIEKR